MTDERLLKIEKRLRLVEAGLGGLKDRAESHADSLIDLEGRIDILHNEILNITSPMKTGWVLKLKTDSSGSWFLALGMDLIPYAENRPSANIYSCDKEEDILRLNQALGVGRPMLVYLDTLKPTEKWLKDNV